MFLMSSNNKMNTKTAHLQLGDITIEVVQKNIKNLHLSVYPPNGRVHISAPTRLDLDTIRVYAISKLNWIKKQQAKFKNQARETPREFLNRESHYFKGKRYLLKLIEHNAPPKVRLQHSTLELYLRPDSSKAKAKSVLDEWYRAQLKSIVPPLIAKWEKKMQVQVNEFGIKRMKTRWGTCNPQAKRVWLNLELAKKPIDCLEYVLVHEMVHLFERHHNDRFVALMDKFLPLWPHYKDELNRLPVGHVEWDY